MKKHLPIYGAGPAFVGGILLTTFIALILQYQGILPVLTLPALRIPQQILGLILLVGSPVLWLFGAIFSQLGKHIKENKLVTEGIFAWVRNPVYSAFLYFTWGVILWNDNLYLWFLGLCHWLYLTLLLKFTEERWLLETYGIAYQEYCQRVNRCILFPPLKDRI